jgi:hypothetical protein
LLTSNTRRGIYFAAKSIYSNSYAFNPSKGLTEDMPSWNERPNAQNDEREIFLTKLLIGNEIWMSRNSPEEKAKCRALTVPPMDTNTGLKYNTVTGMTKGSQVWIVYENGRAYPDYLVRYYRGKRDTTRTPFKDEDDAKQLMTVAIKRTYPKRILSVPYELKLRNPTAKKAVKKLPDLLDTMAWTNTSLPKDSTFPCLSSQPLDLEGMVKKKANKMWEFQMDDVEVNFESPSERKKEIKKSFLIQSGKRTYEIDQTEMTQESVSHSQQRQRLIRRCVQDIEQHSVDTCST